MSKTIYFMVGLPGSGKSTWTDKDTNNTSVVLGSDNWIQMWADEQGKTYDEIFLESIKEASQKFEYNLTSFLENGSNIILDRTNLTRATRMRYLSKVPDTYKKVAVVAPTHPLESFIRMRARVGKTLPEDKFIKMMNSYECPSLEEGFDEIITIER